MLGFFYGELFWGERTETEKWVPLMDIIPEGHWSNGVTVYVLSNYLRPGAV